MTKIVGYNELAELVPESRPLLMIDRLALADDRQSASAVKCVSMDEEYFQGHFPGEPIMPGVLQLAAMTQTAGVLASGGASATSSKLPMLTAIQRLKFRRPVSPGDFLEIQVERRTDDATLYQARTLVDGEVTCQGNLKIEMMDRESLAAPPRALKADLMPLLNVPVHNMPLTIKEIMHAIPHRYPFILIDRVLLLDSEIMRIVGIKNVTGNEPLFAGTPVPMLPTYLQAEMAAQAGCTMALAKPENLNKLVFFASIDEAVFYHPIVPGDQLMIDITLSLRGQFGRADGKIFVGDQTVAELALKFAVMDRP